MATCSRRSPNSSLILSSAPESIASSSSYVSSSRYGRRDSCVCSRSHGQPSGARRRATTSKIAWIPGEYGLSFDSGMGPDSGSVLARLVKGGHLVEELQQLRLPAFSLPSHLQAVWPNRDSAGHSSAELVDVKEALGVDSNHDVVAVGHPPAQADPLSAELDSKRVRKVVELLRPRAVAILQRPQHRIQLLFVLSAGQLAIRTQTQFLVPYV